MRVESRSAIGELAGYIGFERSQGGDRRPSPRPTPAKERVRCALLLHHRHGAPRLRHRDSVLHSRLPAAPAHGRHPDRSDVVPVFLDHPALGRHLSQRCAHADRHGGPWLRRGPARGRRECRSVRSLRVQDERVNPRVAPRVLSRSCGGNTNGIALDAIKWATPISVRMPTRCVRRHGRVADTPERPSVRPGCHGVSAHPSIAI